MLWATCAHCGMSVALAGGFNAQLMTRAQQLDALRRMGWEVVPKYRCNNCIKYGWKI